MTDNKWDAIAVAAANEIRGYLSNELSYFGAVMRANKIVVVYRKEIYTIDELNRAQIDAIREQIDASEDTEVLGFGYADPAPGATGDSCGTWAMLVRLVGKDDPLATLGWLEEVSACYSGGDFMRRSDRDTMVRSVAMLEALGFGVDPMHL